jgi:hypothetical protein
MGWKRIALPVLAGAALLAFGCAFEAFGHARGYRFFASAAPADPWHGKIRGWQARERALPDTEQLAPAPASVSERGAAAAPDAGPLDLRTKYFAFRREQKRAVAAAAAAWIQREARNHYRPDGAVDHWATLGETLERDGEDCDGLELLVYHHLRDMGFRDDEVTRAIVLRPRDGQHHMVTLWFESPDDPFVIDPTGAMTSGMPRLSEVPGWVPVELFTETAHYTPEPRDVRP